MHTYFKDKVIIITGASSGIGLATARLFAGMGAKLSLAARSIDRLESLASELTDDRSRILCIKTDVSVEEDCRRLIEETVRRFGKIDILINNAGISMRAPFLDVNLEVIKKLMNVNFWGTVYCTKYALPEILKTKGSIAGVISTAGYVAIPGRTGYVTSKYAIRGFLETLRIEHLNDGINILVFAPGYTASNVRNAALLADGSPQGYSPKDEGKLMSAEKVAEKLAYGLYRRKKEMILTALGYWDIWLYRRFPRLMDRVQLHYIRRKEKQNDPFR
ncbi:MAG: SDR family oxidoreductase, partial [Bacteroidales bacterium]|jgi:short-subunit dehydrogenase|nr:SDR family oxidoreductase [Bacteroidales bacterium]